MKRSLAALVLILLAATASDAATTKKKTHKVSKKTTTQEQTLTRLHGDAEPATNIEREKKQADPDGDAVVAKPGPMRFGPPVELQLKRASSRRFDLRSLPQTKPIQQERAELPEPAFHPVTVQGIVNPPSPSTPVGNPVPLAPAPPPIGVFEGLDRFNWGAGSPPDTNGDAGPANFIQTVNTSIGVFRKSDGFRQAAFTFNTFMSQGAFGNLCDTNNFGDPVVVYDTFEDRWIITDFAFVLDGGGNVVAPAFQCFAASMTGDPVAGGWNFYSIQITDALNDYPKFGIWPDGLYMSANMFTFGAGSSFKTARVWAFNKAQMYAGSPTVKVVSFDIPGGDFAVMPSNARLQTGTPPPGRPNLFISTELFLNALTIYKFHVDWNSIALSTFTGPDIPLAATSWPNANVQNAGQPGTATLLDTLQIRAMVQNQYTNFGGTESLWIPHTVRRLNTSGVAAPRWYQANVTGGTVAPNLVQATTWDPDGANNTNRFMPSLALDRAGNMAMGYSVASAVNEVLTTSPAANCTTCLDIFPSIRYAGRLAADPINTFSQTEQTFFTGTASQTGTTRWGDYSAMTLDPDGCTFWYTSEYANPADQTFDHRWLTKFGSIPAFPGCVPVGAGGTVSGTVTVNPGGAPISGATVNLGAGRSTTTDGSGNYSFTGIPAGTYPSMTASKPGFVPGAATSIVVTDGGTTTQNFSLAAAPASACLTDTTQADFQAGVPTNVDLTTTPGDVTLAKPDVIDQQNPTVTNSGFGFNSTSWAGQTFIAGATGPVTRADIDFFCSGCTGTTPNLTIAIRAATGSPALPTGPDLATATITGFNTGAGGYFSAFFATPTTITAGTTYAVIFRATANPSAGTYAYVCSCTSPNSNPYLNGARVTSANSGGTWAADVTSGGRDIGFKIFVNPGYSPSGSLISSPKDANPSGGITPIWSTFSWNGATPTNTSLKFQLAGSNNVNGPFNFVGPDGTAGTFFTTSPVQLSPQFYNFRFLEYKALLGSTDSTATPTLNDDTTCFNDVDCSSTVATITPTPASVCTNSAGNSASGPAGMTAYAWGIANGTITSATNIQTITYTAGASGTVTLSLTITAPNGCIVSGSAPVTINQPPPTPTISGTNTFCTGGSTLLTSTSATSYQWYLNGGLIGGATNQTYNATAGGDYTVAVTDANNCGTSTSAIFTVTVTPTPPTPTITPNGSVIACDSGTLTSSSATGNQWYYQGNLLPGETNQTLNVDTDGDYTVVVTVNGCPSAPSAATSVDAHVRPGPAFLTAGGPTTFCAGGSVTLSSNSATGIQWYLDGNPLPNPNNQNRTVSVGGTYTVTLNNQGCISNVSNSIVVTVNPLPATPTATPGGPTTFCAGGSVTLTSSAGSGNQWFLNGNPIGGATNTTYVANASGSYTVKTTDGNSCTSAASAAVVVTVNPLPAAPTITGASSFCTGGSTTLTSSAASGNQWFLNGNPIGGATNTTYVATAAGSYTVTTTDGNGCTSAASAAKVVTVNPNPDATITAPVSVPSGSVGNVASVANAGAGATYTWGITNGTITGGTGTNSITFTAGAVGTLTLNVTVTTGAGCSDSKSKNVTVTAPLVTVTSVSPTGGTIVGGSAVTINGTGFAAGASVTFGGSAATNVVVVSAVKITARTPAHALGAVNVTVTNTDTTNGTLVNGYLYKAQQFDPNNDGTISPMDIFYLVNYLYMGGPPPAGAAGVLSGDANGDGVVNPLDIFYLVNYLFLGGPRPNSISDGPVTAMAIGSNAAQLDGSIALGKPVLRDGRYFVPVIMTAGRGSMAPQAMSLRVHFDGEAGNVSIQKAGAAKDLAVAFETDRFAGNDLSYLVSYGNLHLGTSASAVVAEIEVESSNATLSIDPQLTMLSNQAGTMTASVSNGKLKVTGTKIGDGAARPRTPGHEVN
jgi:hypothetical protein